MRHRLVLVVGTEFQATPHLGPEPVELLRLGVLGGHHLLPRSCGSDVGVHPRNGKKKKVLGYLDHTLNLRGRA